MDQFRMITAAGVIVAAVTGYVFWGPSSKPKSRAGNIPGLLNMGNTCFLNAVLQAVAACPAFVSWLTVVISRHNLFNPYGSEPHLSLCKALLETLEVLNNLGDVPITEYEPHKILSALREHHWVISSDEQDAHEMFLLLSSTIDEELGLSKDKRRCSLEDVKMLDEPVAWDSYELNALTPTVFPLSPFKGLLTSRLMCKNCENKCPLKYDTFDSLSISIPPLSHEAVTLQTCLKYFVMSELIPNVDCENCAQNLQENARTTFLKQLSIGKLPSCLCIHIQRTVWQRNGMPKKRFEHVIYPEYLNMDEFLYNNQNFQNLTSICKHLVGGSASIGSSTVGLNLRAHNLNSFFLPSDLLASSSKTETHRLQPERNLYRLQSVIVHLGDVYTGHFVTYRRGPMKSKYTNNWYLTSDATVRKSTIEEVLKYPAYVLFYERVLPATSNPDQNIRRLSICRRVQL